MPPRTRMTAEQVAASVDARRTAYTERTGIPLVPHEEDERRRREAGGTDPAVAASAQDLRRRLSERPFYGRP
jgi:hypothetical protein